MPRQAHTIFNPRATPANRLGRLLLKELHRKKPDVDLMLSFIRQGAALDLLDAKYDTALFLAAGRGYLSVVDAILDRGILPNQTNQWDETALLAAAREGQLDVVRLLIARGAKVNKQTLAGTTPLILAAKNGHIDAVRELLAENADVNIPGYEGFTALMEAASAGHKEIVELLLDHDAEIDAKSKSETTAFIVACTHGHVEVARLLKEKGANPHHCMVAGQALNICALAGELDSIKFLVEECDVDINATNWRGWTAMMEAAAEGNMRVVKYLGNKRVDLEIKDNQNEQAYNLAKRRGHTKTAALIQSFKKARAEAVIRVRKGSPLRKKMRASVQIRLKTEPKPPR